MDIGTMAARRQVAIEEIERKTEINVSRVALPKANAVDLFQLFQLEKLAQELPEANADTLEEVLHKIFNVPGVGPALFEKIKAALKE